MPKALVLACRDHGATVLLEMAHHKLEIQRALLGQDADAAPALLLQAQHLRRLGVGVGLRRRGQLGLRLGGRRRLRLGLGFGHRHRKGGRKARRLLFHRKVRGELGNVDRADDRLPLDARVQEILSIPVRKVVLHVAPGRNLAVLLEAAVRNSILQMRGIDSMNEFINRQQQAVFDDDL